MHSVWLAMAALAACWESWRWYLQRVWSTPEEAVALAAAVGLVVLVRLVPSSLPNAGRERRSGISGAFATSPRSERRSLEPSVSKSSGAARIEAIDRVSERSSPRPLVVLLLLYVLALPFAPPILRAGIAALALLYALDRSPPPALLVMGLLATPVVPTLQFTLGYPMRLVSAAMSVALLRLNGLAVERQGTYLSWRGELVQFDAPCSGVSMLWAGLLLTAMIAYLYRLSWLRLGVALVTCAVLLIGANILRATSLFYLESGMIVHAPAWLHEASGLTAFAVAMPGIAWVTERMTRDFLPLAGRMVPQNDAGCSGGRLSLRREGTTIASGVPGAMALLSRREGKATAATLCAAVLAAALFPLLVRGPGPAASADARFPGFPAAYDGQPLTELPLSAKEVAFAADFPGRIGRFTDGRREIIVRYVSTATRKLHPASDCFRGLGYRVSPIPMRRNPAGQAMSCFEAKGPGGAYRVCEHLDDGIGNFWPDVGAWYWTALFARSGGWWSYTVAEGM